MCLEGRNAALLVALASVVVSACGGGRSAPPALPHASDSPPSSSAGPPPPPAELAIPAGGARVRGRLETTDHRPLINGAVVMKLKDEGLSPVPVNAMVFPDGSFTFSGVGLGTYQIRALAQVTPAETLFALSQLTIGDADVEGLVLSLHPGARVSGLVNVERVRAPTVPPLQGLRVRAPFADGSTFGEALTGQVHRGGAFALRGLMAGAHVFVVDGLEDPWVVKSVTYRNEDISDTAIEADSGQHVEDVRITITDVASEVAGMVRDDAGQPAAHALVLFVPVPPQFYTVASRRFGRVRTDAAGRYRIRGLPEGEYRAAATTDLDERDASRLDAVRAIHATGRPLSLPSLATPVLDLGLSPLALIRRTPDR